MYENKINSDYGLNWYILKTASMRNGFRDEERLLGSHLSLAMTTTATVGSEKPLDGGGKRVGMAASSGFSPRFPPWNHHTPRTFHFFRPWFTFIITVTYTTNFPGAIFRLCGVYVLHICSCVHVRLFFL